MSNNTKYLIGAGVIAAAYYFFRLKRTGQNIKVNLANVSLRRSSGLSLPTVRMDFEIQNPTNGTANIKGVVGDVYINGQYLANVSNLTTTQVKPNSSTIYSVDVKAGITDTITTLISLLSKKNAGSPKGVNFTADLNVNVNDILFPVKIDRKLV